MALDVIWDEELNPFIMEINRWPGLDQVHSRVFKATVFSRVFPEAVQIVIDAHPEVFGPWMVSGKTPEMWDGWTVLWDYKNKYY